jgi:hypothetical protein
MRRLLYVPVYPEVARADRARLAEAIHGFAAAKSVVALGA